MSIVHLLPPRQRDLGLLERLGRHDITGLHYVHRLQFWNLRVEKYINIFFKQQQTRGKEIGATPINGV